LGTTSSNADPTGWYVSEKLDGVRIWWNAKGEIKTSTLKPINPPKGFLQNLPKQITLEGELW
jgi:DNA ligase-1